MGRNQSLAGNVRCRGQTGAEPEILKFSGKENKASRRQIFAFVEVISKSRHLKRDDDIA